MKIWDKYKKYRTYRKWIKENPFDSFYPRVLSDFDYHITKIIEERQLSEAPIGYQMTEKEVRTFIKILYRINIAKLQYAYTQKTSDVFVVCLSSELESFIKKFKYSYEKYFLLRWMKVHSVYPDVFKDHSTNLYSTSVNINFLTHKKYMELLDDERKEITYNSTVIYHMKEL